jgi:FRG domain
MSTELDKYSFQEISIKSFDDFETKYHIIRKNRNYQDAVFRGQSDSSWGLVPSIFRDSIDKEKLTYDYFVEKLSQEFSDVKDFVKIADHIGIELPGELQTLLNNRDRMEDLKRDVNFTINWYNKAFNPYLELMTIAQHHGVNTRFIDFSFNAYTALYFAAEGAFNKLYDSDEKEKLIKDNFALWGIDRRYLYNADCSIGHFEVPTARNRYLNAQRGLFLYVDSPIGVSEIDSSDVDIKEVAIKDCVEIVEKSGPEFRSIWPVIFKFNFPYDISPEVLRELDRKH